MRDIHYDSPQALARLLDEHKLTVKKRFGQNFLINHDARRRLVELLGIKGGERVWEIGPGVGALTRPLLEKDISLSVFEIDRGFVRLLRQVFADQEELTIVEGDFIRTWKGEIKRGGAPDLIIGNLPYSSAAAIFLALIQGKVQARKIVCTVQKEGAQRMTAAPGTSDYGSFSVLCSLIWEIRSMGDLKPGSFFPPPRVQSTMIELTPRGQNPRVPVEYLLTVTRSLFANRRKTIRNNLRMLAKNRDVDPDTLFGAALKAAVDVEARPETLSPGRVETLLWEMYECLPLLVDGEKVKGTRSLN
jgi:16S rRNA (adenine1518-N6/adenine1519-N6)-dimethyltransferase